MADKFSKGVWVLLLKILDLSKQTILKSDIWDAKPGMNTQYRDSTS